MCERRRRRLMQPSNRGRSLSARRLVATARWRSGRWPTTAAQALSSACLSADMSLYLSPRTRRRPDAPRKAMTRRRRHANSSKHPPGPGYSTQNGNPIAIHIRPTLRPRGVPRLSASLCHSLHPRQCVPVLSGLRICLRSLDEHRSRCVVGTVAPSP